MNKFYQVAINFPRKQSVYTYEAEQGHIRGDLVEVPFGKRKAKGIVLGGSTPDEITTAKEFNIKKISNILENSFVLSEKELSLYEWMSGYYHYSLGKLIYDCLPKFLKRPRDIEFIQGQNLDIPFDLTENQKAIYEAIQTHLGAHFSQHYIHGVTGSGKSAIYLALMKKVINSGKSVQFLLPEINLTPQFTKMFSEYLNCPVYTYHSGVTASEKYHIWQKLQNHEGPFLLMGVRSSIFLPTHNLGLMIIDEEHDQSFKQNDRCPYNGRDVAIKKSQILDIPVVLGSATPSVENFKNFLYSNHKYYYPLKERVGEANLPKLNFLDLKTRNEIDDDTWPLMDETLKSIEAAIAKKEQVLVFINKLGFAQFVQCRHCGHQFLNENCGCENNLRFFKKKNILSCSHCDYVMPMPESCPECGSITLMNKGFGTEKVEAVLSALYPQYKVSRFDRDEIKNIKDLEQKLKDFNEQKIDILVGTQMLAKGHNFKRVNLVVVLGIDSSLNFADFRATEKTYQLLEQIAGRAGRYSDSSEVIVQTLNPEHKVFQFIKSHSFDGFYQEELPLREFCHCPPFGRLAVITFSSRFREKLISHVNDVGNKLRAVTASHYDQVQLLGPTPLGIEKKAGQFSWAMMLKSANISQLHQAVATFEKNYLDQSNISFKIDIDPVQIL